MAHAFRLLLARTLGAVKRLIPGRTSNADLKESEVNLGIKQFLWHWAKHLVVFMFIITVGGILLAASGVIPIGATSGHWAITSWLLEFSKRRSVATHSIGLRLPALDDPRLVPRGAGAYDLNCSWCHGRPGFEVSRVAQQMTPPAPHLPDVVQKWQPAELFYIVKHGIKFTGMPAWPTQQRDDEVWDMVAFLRQLPGLDANEYQRIVSGGSSFDDINGEQTLVKHSEHLVLEKCGRCHGADGGGGILNAFPRIAGQAPDYLLASLRAYAQAQRFSGVMEPIAADLSDKEMNLFVQYYAESKGPSPVPRIEDQAAIDRGRSIIFNGIPDQRVQECFSCHGPGQLSPNPNYPRLAGQNRDYLVQQLMLFKEGRRGGTAYSHLMLEVAPNLTPGQMYDVASYYASLTDP